MDGIKLEPVSEPIELPKGLFWVPKTSSLYFIDIYQSNVHRFETTTKTLHTAKVGDKPLAFIIPIEDNDDQFIISYGTELVIIKWDGCSDQVKFLKTITNVEQRPQNRINNGKVSPNGILYTGTTGGSLPSGEAEQEVAALYSFTAANGLKKILPKVSISNGMAWNKELTKFFYIDTPKNTVDVFDYDKTNGTISNGKVLYDFKATKTEGAPDGMTIDSEGNLWVTCWDGYQIIKISPGGKLLGRVKFPAARVTWATFAGPNLDELYVTTAFFGLSSEERNKYQQSGMLFKLTNVGTTGPQDVPFHI